MILKNTYKYGSVSIHGIISALNSYLVVRKNNASVGRSAEILEIKVVIVFLLRSALILCRYGSVGPIFFGPEYQRTTLIWKHWINWRKKVKIPCLWPCGRLAITYKTRRRASYVWNNSDGSDREIVTASCFGGIRSR